MTIIILGNKGSIGSYLHKRFDSLENQVYGFDQPEIDFGNPEKTVSFLEDLFGSKLDLATIINCVGLMGADESRNRLPEYIRINATAPFFLYHEIASKYPSNLFVHLSSETVYGPATESESFSEESTTNPIHNYALSKLIGDILLTQLKRTRPPLILRLPIVLFKEQKFANAAYNVYREAIRDGSVTVFGTGDHRRKYTTTDWLGQDLLAIINQIRNNADSGGIYNFPGLVFSINELLAELEHALAKKIDRNYVDSQSKAFSLVASHAKFTNFCKTTLERRKIQDVLEFMGGEL